MSKDIIEERKDEESLFQCPEVSPVHTNKQSFADNDASQSMIDMCPQLLLQNHNILNLDYRKNPLVQNKGNKFMQLTPQNANGFSITELSQLTCNERREEMDLKDFKEHYIQFGLWPELGFYEQ